MKYPTFNSLNEWAERLNCVLQRESRGYSLYSNTRFIEFECKNLMEVWDGLQECEDFDREQIFNPQSL